VLLRLLEAVITGPIRTDPGVLADFWATLTVGEPGTPVTFGIARPARWNGSPSLIWGRAPATRAGRPLSDDHRKPHNKNDLQK
jgi:hypothetical protein